MSGFVKGMHRQAQFVWLLGIAPRILWMLTQLSTNEAPAQALNLFFSFLLSCYFILWVQMFCLNICAQCVYLVPTDARSKCSLTWNWSYRWSEPSCRWWELNPGYIYLGLYKISQAKRGHKWKRFKKPCWKWVDNSNNDLKSYHIYLHLLVTFTTLCCNCLFNMFHKLHLACPQQQPKI